MMVLPKSLPGSRADTSRSVAPTPPCPVGQDLCVPRFVPCPPIPARRSAQGPASPGRSPAPSGQCRFVVCVHLRSIKICKDDKWATSLLRPHRRPGTGGPPRPAPLRAGPPPGGELVLQTPARYSDTICKTSFCPDERPPLVTGPGIE
jgi:hypothetical protein